MKALSENIDSGRPRWWGRRRFEADTDFQAGNRARRVSDIWATCSGGWVGVNPPAGFVFVLTVLIQILLSAN